MDKVFAHLRASATIFAIAVVLTACSGGKSPISPTANTPVPTPLPGGSITGATITGTVGGGASPASFRTMGAGLTVTIVGTSVSVQVDASGNFKLQGVPTGDVVLQFSGNGADARLSITGVSDHEEIRITVRVSGTEVEVDENERETADHRVEIEGTITALGAHSLTLGNKTVVVPAGTPIRHGGTMVDFSQLRVGDRVHVHATKNGTDMTATEIELQTSNPGNPGPPVDHEVELEGAVSSVSGSCPSLSFMVSGKKVTTSASTQFKGGTCSQIVNGTMVEMQGTTQANGSVSASRVEIKKQEDQEEVELTGAISGLGGSCPNLTLTVSSKSVTTNASTRFKDTTCRSLKNGDKVEVNGTKQSNGSVLATSVAKDN
jgi:hypothetical protein